MKRISAIALVFFLAWYGTAGQNTKNYTPVNMYMMNPLLINPGYAGAKDSWSITGMYGKSWVGMPGAGNMMTVTGHTPLGEGKVAIGFLASNNAFGINRNTNAYFYYTYRITVGAGKIGLGLRAGGNNYSRELTQAEFLNPADPVIKDESRFFPNFGVGAYWYTNDFYLGLSIPDFFFPPEGSGAFDADPRNYSYTFTGGYLFRVNDNFKVKPSTLISYSLNAPVFYQANTSFIFYQDMIWLGASYKPNGLVAIAEFQVSKWLRLGYAYEFPVGDLAGYTTGSHEFLIRFISNFELRAVNPGYFW
jgi:type IX secretion system PorP/SprF family membrane protein